LIMPNTPRCEMMKRQCEDRGEVEELTMIWLLCAKVLILLVIVLAHVARLIPALLLAPPQGLAERKGNPIVPRKRSGSGETVVMLCTSVQDQ
jgi:hypothetical protein